MHLQGDYRQVTKHEASQAKVLSLLSAATSQSKLGKQMSPFGVGGGAWGKRAMLVSQVKQIARTRVHSQARLRTEVPGWYKPTVPVKDAADDFDKRHRALAQRSHRAIRALHEDLTHLDKRRAFEESLRAIRRNRFHVIEQLDEFIRPPTPPPMVKKGPSNVRRWTIEESIWGPRKGWTDSKAYHDHKEHMRKCFEMDYELCLKAHKTDQFISRLDGESGIGPVGEVLWEHLDAVYGMFDYYATFGASDDIIHIHVNGFKSFTDDCKLVVAGSKHCGSSSLDQLFVMVNTGSDVARALNRQEWFQCLIRIAVMRRDALNPRATTTVADELQTLIQVQLLPNVDPRALPDLHKFRKENCYTPEVSFILEDHEQTLRNLFVEFAKGDGTALYNELKSAKLLSYNEWKMLTRDTEMMNELDFTVRDMQLVFSWSRTRVIDERPMQSKVRLTQLSFEDFCEGICRLAFSKALPTEEEAYDAGCEDGGEMMINMIRDEPLEYYAFVADRADDQDLRQEMWSQVNQLCTLVVRTVENTVSKNKGNQRMKKKKVAKENYIDESEAKLLFSLSTSGGVQSAVQTAIKLAQTKMGVG